MVQLIKSYYIMARLKNGISGPIVGKLGNHVGYIRLGQPLIRMKSIPTKKKRSPAQKASTNAFSIVSKFVSPIRAFTDVSFKPYVAGTTQIPRNAGMSLNLPAVYGEYPDQHFDFSKAIVAAGVLPAALNPVAELSVYDQQNRTVKLKFSWESDPNCYGERQRDQVMMLAFFPETGKSSYCTSGARRVDRSDVLGLDVHLKNDGTGFDESYVETYIAFVSDDRMEVSNSTYCGRINLTA